MNYHVMEKTPKLLTIVGLVLEGFAAASSIVWGFIFLNAEQFAFIDFVYASIEADEEWIFELMSGVIGMIFLVLGISLGLVFLVNLVLFRKLMNSNLTEEGAKKVYKYQIIWGIISLLLNTITGILYVISGFQGIEGQKKQTEFSEGL